MTLKGGLNMPSVDGPGGRLVWFETDEDAEAYKQAMREAEPPLLRRLRKHHHVASLLI
jgi:hypothetical protein